MVFGDIVGTAVMHLVFPFKLLEYGLLFSENMRKCIWRNRLDLEDEDCLYVLYNLTHTVGQEFSQDRDSALFCPFSQHSNEIILSVQCLCND